MPVHDGRIIGYTRWLEIPPQLAKRARFSEPHQPPLGGGRLARYRRRAAEAEAGVTRTLGRLGVV